MNFNLKNLIWTNLKIKIKKTGDNKRNKKIERKIYKIIKMKIQKNLSRMNKKIQWIFKKNQYKYKNKNRALI
jgi:hypothetical protein